LNRHLQVLQEAMMVGLAKAPDRDQTIYRITSLGRKRYLDYLSVLEQVLLDGAPAAKTLLDKSS
jgi:hypothetical protein